jgi:hypothetical protein
VVVTESPTQGTSSLRLRVGAAIGTTVGAAIVAIGVRATIGRALTSATVRAAIGAAIVAIGVRATIGRALTSATVRAAIGTTVGSTVVGTARHACRTTVGRSDAALVVACFVQGGFGHGWFSLSSSDTVSRRFPLPMPRKPAPPLRTRRLRRSAVR